MPALADLFKTCYLTGGSGVEFSAIRLHYRGVDEICRAFGATALTVGSDIFFRREAAAWTPHGSARSTWTRSAPCSSGLAGIRVTSTRNDCGLSTPAPRRCACPAVFQRAVQPVAHQRDENPRVRRLPPVRRALTGHRGPAKRVTAPAHYR